MIPKPQQRLSVATGLKAARSFQKVGKICNSQIGKVVDIVEINKNILDWGIQSHNDIAMHFLHTDQLLFHLHNDFSMAAQIMAVARIAGASYTLVRKKKVPDGLVVCIAIITIGVIMN